VCSERHYTYYIGKWGKSEKFAALKVPRYCTIVLLVNLGSLQGKMLGSEEGKVMKWTVESLQQRTEVEHKGCIFVFGGLHYEEILIAFRGMNFTINFGVNFGDGSMRST